MNKRILALLLFSLSAHAEMEVCNFSQENIDLAVGKEFFYPNNAAVYQSEGWYFLRRGECVQLDPSGQRKLWLYAMGSNGSRWAGLPGDFNSRHFCIDTRNRFNYEEWRNLWGIHSSPETCHWYGGRLLRMSMAWSPNRYHRVEFIGGKPWNHLPTYQTQPAPLAPLVPVERPPQYSGGPVAETYREPQRSQYDVGQPEQSPSPSRTNVDMQDRERAPVMRTPESMSAPFQTFRGEPEVRNTEEHPQSEEVTIPNRLAPSK